MLPFKARIKKIDDIVEDIGDSCQTEIETKGQLAKNSQGPFLILLSAIGFVGLSLISFSALSDKSFSFSLASAKEPIIHPDLFYESIKNIASESPDMIVMAGNSVKAAFPPYTIDPQTLGSIVELEDTELQQEGGVIEYEVETDDTIDSIAKKFNISANTISWANNLSGKSVKPGQTLTILPVSGVVHLIKDGDTVSNIAKTYGGNSDKIIAFNSLSGENDIFIGDMLIIPDGKLPAPSKQAPSGGTLRNIAGIPVADSYFLFPAQGRISQGPHGALRAAIDIANSCGTPIVAAAGGTVQRVGMIAIGGNRVTILHPNGVVTYYGHFSSMTVKAGQKVNAGDVIGYMGRTGLATGCHLHFETRGSANFLAKYKVGVTVGWKK